jgi:hypothetical protein
MTGPRRYTTKVRAKRIELQYFTRSHPFRRWKSVLSIAAPALAALWLLVAAVRDDHRLYNGGPVSIAHAMFEGECRLCHGPGPAPDAALGQASLAAAAATPAGFFLPVTDTACTTCHAGPEHNARSPMPACGGCHVEHVGRVELVQVADRHCVQCHGELTTTDGQPSVFHARIPSLAAHPQFAVGVRDADTLRRVRLDATPGPSDTTAIALNHARHLEPNLKGIEALAGRPGLTGVARGKDGLQLSCTFCHAPDEGGQSMQALSYERHCAACHPLDVGGRFPDLVVPHARPPIVRAFLRGALLEALERCQRLPAGEHAKALRDRCIQLGLSPAPPSWVAAEFGTIEPRLFTQRCGYCHTVARQRDGTTDVAPPAIPARWLPHARFDHGPHRPLACVECHAAATSTRTSDVLLPGIGTCRACHTPRGGARAGCVECHRFHDQRRERDPDGPFRIQHLRSGREP